MLLATYKVTKYILVALVMGSTFTAEADMWKCEIGLGSTTYTNLKNYNKKQGEKCTVFIHDSSKSGGSAAKPLPSSTLSPADFPKVSSETQRGRDNDRHAIVQRETETEQKNLDEAKKSLTERNNPATPEDVLKPIRDRIALHERNLVELQRELSKLR